MIQFLFYLIFKERNFSGKLEAADGERGDKVNLSLRGQDARYKIVKFNNLEIKLYTNT